MAVLIVFLAMLTCFSGAAAQTEVELGIKSSFTKKIPLWIERFRYLDPESKNVSQYLEQLIYADLEFSGFFSMRHGRPPAERGGTESFSFLIRGLVEVENGGEHFEGRVFDAASGRMIGGKRYRLRKKVIRRIAHHFSDEVMRLLTGEKGIASSRLLFVRKSEGKWEIVMSDYDGYGPKVLLRMSRPLLNPRWIMGGKAFVYTGYQYGKPDLFVRKIDERKSRPLATFAGLNYSVDWSEKRGELLVTLSKDGNPEIYLFDIEKGTKKRLTYNRAIDCGPSWSPSGREIAFTSDRSGSPQVYLMESDGSNVRRLTFYGSYNASPAWSPRGDLIAFVSRIEGFFQLCTIKPDGTDMQLITDDPKNHDSPRWAADGRHIIISEDGESGESISIVDITTGGKRLLSKGRNPDWGK